MSNRYVVKPNDIEAIQYFKEESKDEMTGSNNYESISHFLGRHLVEMEAGELYVFDVNTKEWYEVNPTDYVVRFADGSVEVWTPEYFTENYVPAPSPISTSPNWFPNTSPGIVSRNPPYVATWNEYHAGDQS